MPLSVDTILSQSGRSSDGNEGLLCIFQSSSIIGTSPLDSFVSYPGHLLWGVLLLGGDAVGVFYSSSRVGKYMLGYSDLLNRPNIEMNTIWESIIKIDRF